MIFKKAKEILEGPGRAPKETKPAYQQHAALEGYNRDVDAIRDTEYPQLKDQVYLDNAGLPPCARSVVENAGSCLLKTLYGNPHSQSEASLNAERAVKKTRLQVLDIFHLDPKKYDLIFTQNATHAIKLIGQGFKDTFAGFDYHYSVDSHTSILGVRELASGFSTFETPQDVGADAQLDSARPKHPALVAWTGQSNFNGKRYPIQEWNREFKATDHVYTLVDISSLSSTAPPDFSLAESVPDMMVLSLYKMFGYPDLGCMIVNKAVGDVVFAGKRYFGGGTVDAISVDGFRRDKTDLPSLLEEGTLPIHNIIQLSAVIDTFLGLFTSFAKIGDHTKALTRYTVNGLRMLSHDNAEPMVEILGSSGSDGPIVTFCLLDRNGLRLGFYDFEKYASAKGFSLRTGALCNTGATSMALGITSSDIRAAYQLGQKCGDGADLINGKVKGVIRLSFGAMTTLGDVERFVECVQDFFHESFFTGFSSVAHSDLKVKNITVYPIKSCGGYDVPANNAWIIDENGLAYDRLFCLLDPSTREPLLLKNHPQMTFIRPVVDPVQQRMVIRYRHSSVEISLKDDFGGEHETVELQNPKSGARFECIVDTEICHFLQEIVASPCVLARPKKPVQNMHNKSDFLVLSNSSIDYLENYDRKEIIRGSASRFRGNIVIQGKDLKPFEEDNWSRIAFSSLVLKNVELCERCHMITIDSETGKRDTSQYVRLSKFRKLNGKVLFGINCNIEHPPDDGDRHQFTLAVGDSVAVE